MSGFIAVAHQSNKIGKYKRGTKEKDTWTFNLMGVLHCLNLFHNRLSGKIKIILDGDIIVSVRNPTASSFPIKIGSRVLHVYQKRDLTFDIRVGRISFSKLTEEKDLMRSFRTSRKRDNIENPLERSFSIEKPWKNSTHLSLIHI